MFPGLLTFLILGSRLPIIKKVRSPGNEVVVKEIQLITYFYTYPVTFEPLQKHIELMLDKKRIVCYHLNENKYLKSNIGVALIKPLYDY